jgi:prephenate dehydrogenase
MAPDAHDGAMAEVSHLPHVAAFALALAVGRREDLRGLFGGGFADTTRIAGSDPLMWRDIFLTNRAPLLGAIDHYLLELRALRDRIDQADGPALAAIVAEANRARARVLGS